MGLAKRAWVLGVMAAVGGACAMGAAPAGGQAAAPAASRPFNGKIVTLDHFYNTQFDKTGQPFHYLFSDYGKTSGFSKFGDVWKQQGAQISELTEAPTADDLKKMSVYIICNPATVVKAAPKQPNYISEPAIGNVVQWVKDGGVLLLMANDKNSCEFDHFNELCTKFGIKFDGNLRNSSPTTRDHPHAVFTRARDKFPDVALFDGVDMFYMKEISTITITPPAKAYFEADKDPKESVPGPGKDVIMATSEVGKGFVFAVGDPWIYNEYIDQTWPEVGLPVQNRKAAENLVKVLLARAALPQAK